MGDTKPAATATAGPSNSNETPATQAEYKKSQQRIRDLVRKKAALDQRLLSIEDTISQKEGIYLESTPTGNIITGFDNYMKGQSGAAAQRRKAGPLDQNRVFSKSSISYRPGVNDTSPPGSTPASHAPTPLSASFKDTGTPTSAAGGKNRNKKKGGDNEESETDSQANRKRTNFGAPRK